MELEKMERGAEDSRRRPTIVLQQHMFDCSLKACCCAASKLFYFLNFVFFY